MNVIINGPQFFLLLDNIFSDLSVNKIRSLNPTYIIKYNDEEIFHYENGVVNVGLDFINKVKSFVPVKIDKEFVINVAKWIRSKTGLKPRTIWIGLKQYNVGPHLNENTTLTSAGEYNGPIELGLKNWAKSLLDPFINSVESEFNRKSKSKDLRGNEDTVVGMWEKGVDGTYEIDTEDVNTVKESEDKPMKKFNRDNNPDKGKYGKLIEEIALSYFKNPDDVCDIICIKTGPNQTGLGDYILLVLMSYSMSETKLSEYIKGFVPIDVMVLINTSYHCKDED
jgi:hypothetical protein